MCCKTSIFFCYLLGFLRRNRTKIFKLPVYCESIVIICFCRSQWPCGRRRGSTASRVMGLQVRISPGAWMSVCCECCVLSGVGLCVGLITRPEESCRVWCVWVWSWSLDRPARGCNSMENNCTFLLTSLLLFIVLAVYNDCLLDGGYKLPLHCNNRINDRLETRPEADKRWTLAERINGGVFSDVAWIVDFRFYRPLRIKKLPGLILVPCFLEDLNILSFNMHYFVRQFFFVTNTVRNMFF
jgi:hypothetical protein